jgi:hypothetical protein
MQNQIKAGFHAGVRLVRYNDVMPELAADAFSVCARVQVHKEAEISLTVRVDDKL